MNQRASKNSVPPSVGVDVSGIETLLNRNLPEVFGEGDPARRRSAIQELYAEDCVLYVPPGTFVGHDALDKFAGDLRATHPHYVYAPVQRSTVAPWLLLSAVVRQSSRQGTGLCKVSPSERSRG
jgi:hypothetical protein